MATVFALNDPEVAGPDIGVGPAILLPALISVVPAWLMVSTVRFRSFRDLVTHSLRLQALVRRMDEEIYGGTAATTATGRLSNPVSDQISLLNTAFARG